jgi:Zn-dependent protease
LVPAVLSLGGLGAYGWAKPVPVNPGNLRSPRNHIVLVSLVGPLTNFVLAALMGVVFVAVGGRTALHEVFSIGQLSLIEQIMFYGGFANIMLGVFNLIPCPPLDGAAFLERLIPARNLPGYWNLQPALMFLPFLLILIFRGPWADFVNHVETWWLQRLA